MQVVMTNVIKTKLQRQKKNNNSFFGSFENHGPVQSMKRKEMQDWVTLYKVGEKDTD